ncbi:adenine phosphoribosyltransferase [Spiroplasma endosymbiont of Nephrotoma flavescens]|uniref:adenine phosphoribosyltransferase n=1 Tax=Spiroplasma endosymbiont of Nephrotoma flavescens TaxID=3066302 RepID=UPI00313D4941
MDLKELIIDVPNFPKPGIQFKDITPLLANGVAFKQVVKQLEEIVKSFKPDVIVAPEARGFIFATPVASELGLGFVPIRKSDKLPRAVIHKSYELEYNKSTLAIHKDAIVPGMKVVIVDDLLANGGTIDAIINLIEELQGEVIAAVFVIELTSFKAREQFPNLKIESLIQY